MEVIGYVRVSTEGQAEDGVSLAAQSSKIRAWAHLDDREVAHIYKDAGISGAKLSSREGLQAAILHACKVKGALAVYSLSRLARSTRDTLAISEQLSKAGAELVSLSEKIDTTSASGKMIFRLLAVLAEFERDQVSERTRVAMNHLRATGRRVSRFAPYGWNFSAAGDELVINEQEQLVIERIKQLRASGRSPGWIADSLTDHGITTKRGKQAWSAKVVRSILKRLEEAYP
ncbi:MAG: recombinase family protein [Planctomycetes bacterium]|nr:recombinase family protein [Planctomycetota bacterium]